jgi:hypothetical protein
MKEELTEDWGYKGEQSESRDIQGKIKEKRDTKEITRDQWDIDYKLVLAQSGINFPVHNRLTQLCLFTKVHSSWSPE